MTQGGVAGSGPAPRGAARAGAPTLRCAPAAAPAAVAQLLLAAALAALLASAPAAGQGLQVPFTLGADGQYRDLFNTWNSQYSSARALHERWRASQKARRARARAQPRAGCAPGSRALCGGNLPAAAAGDAAVLEVMGSPQAYDSRRPADTGGLDLVHPPMDQGACNACVGFALVSAAETAMAAALRANARELPRLSTRDLFFCNPKGSGSCNNGWTYQQALENLVQRQVVAEEACMPWAGFRAKPGDPCNELAQQCESGRVPPGEFVWDRSVQLDSNAKIMRFIRDHGSVLTAMMLYEGGAHLRRFFASKGRGAVYTYDGPPSAKGAVAHAVAVVGYNARAAPQHWIVKNSFGTAFADQGFFRVAFGEAGIMDPSLTFGVLFRPAARLSYEGVVELRREGDLPDGCSTYAGDYAAAVAAKVGVPLPDLLQRNIEVFLEDPGAVLPPGTRLAVCAAAPPRKGGADAGLAPPPPPPPPPPVDLLPRLPSGTPGLGVPTDAPPRSSAAGGGPARGSSGADAGGGPSASDSKAPGDGAAGGGEAGRLLAASCCTTFDWLAGGDHCKWFGVTCAAGKVTRIDLSSSTLIGRLETASAWADLAGLTSIDVSVNRLSGVLPLSWSRLSGLTFLDAHDNMIQSTLPPAWGSLRRLETLDLSSNSLFGPIPKSFGGLAALRYLNLAGNSLAGDLPAGLAGLRQLDTLNVSANKLSGPLPRLPAPMPALVALLLDGNALSGTLPPSLGSALPALRTLSVYGNRRLSGCLPAAWRGRVMLLDAETNAFTDAPTRGALKGTAITGFCGG
ncbi:MAG: hypothetical protein J3K34DRAFT_521289 [Monoraphidium minutum]|nr:MAG: hypothetical protein J3K34DRAFT_521289 [Monoraphidium minutum]